MAENSRNCGVSIETGVDVDEDPTCGIRGLMLRDGPSERNQYGALVNGISVKFLVLGDYGHFTNSKDFRHEGNIFTDLNSLGSNPDFTPRQHKVRAEDERNTNSDSVIANTSSNDRITPYNPLGLSLPGNHRFNSLYLVTRVIQCATFPSSERIQFCLAPYIRCLIIELAPILNATMPLCTIAEPFVWHRDEGTGSASVIKRRAKG
ncbi:hypothetical protein V8B97DRAFT_1989892 [Scleroderma yunnanense]